MVKFLLALISLICVFVMVALVPFGAAPMVYDGRVEDKRAPRGVRTARRHDEAYQSLVTRRKWYGTPMIKENFENITAMGLGLRTVFMEQLTAIVDESQDSLATLFNIQNSTKAVERSQGMGGFGDVPEYKGTIEYDDFELLYRQVYTPIEYAKGMAIERALIDDAEYNTMTRRANLLGISFDRTIYKMMADIFNNGFSTNRLGGDAQPLMDTDHPNSASDATTQSNEGTSALSHDAVIATRILMRKFADSNGNALGIIPDTIVVPVELEAAAYVIVESLQKSGTANNDRNFNSGYRVITSNYLTDPNNWFMVDFRMARMYLNWYWRVRPEFTEDPTSNYNLVMKYRGYMRYSFGWDHWAWVYGHNVA